jgi:hypothetical protein
MEEEIPSSSGAKLVDKEQSYRWLKFGDIKGESGCSRGNSGSGCFKRKRFVKEGTESKWRLCKECEEVDNLTSGCPIMAKNEYIIIPDKLCEHLYYSACKKLGIQAAENRYSHITKAVYGHEDITVLWNRGVQTDRKTDRGSGQSVIQCNRKHYH